MYTTFQLTHLLLNLQLPIHLSKPGLANIKETIRKLKLTLLNCSADYLNLQVQTEVLTHTYHHSEELTNNLSQAIEK